MNKAAYIGGDWVQESREDAVHEAGAAQPRLDFVHYSLDFRDNGGNGKAGPLVPALLPRRIDFCGARLVELDFDRVDRRLVTLYDTEPRAGDEYRKLAVSVIAARVRRKFKRLLIASPGHGDGRTCTLLNLAGALSRAGRRVLVVDTDALRPSVLRLLGVEADLGIAEVVSRRLEPEQAAFSVLPGGFTVLPSRGPFDSAERLFSSKSLGRILRHLDPFYDFMLFDSAPLLAAAETNLLRRLCDLVLMVVRPGATSVDQMARAVSLFEKDDLLGVVLNRT